MIARYSTYLLVTLLFFTVFLRFYQLGAVPEGLNIDEASYGYDALSIKETGKDQWGNKFPVFLKSYGDYKPSGQSYTISLFLNFIDLNTLATRLPSAISGTITLLGLYLILSLITKNTNHKLFLLIVFSASPWSFGISRLFYETNLALMFFVFGWYQLYKSYFKEKPNFVLASTLLAISGYFYTSFRFISLGIVILFFLLDRNNKQYKLRNLILSLTIFFAISIPAISANLGGEGLNRLSQESDLRSYGHALSIDENRSMCFIVSNKNPVFTKFCYYLWNKPVDRVFTIGKTFLLALSPDYLFLESSQSDVLPDFQGAYVFGLALPYLLGLTLAIKKSLKKNIESVFLLGSIIIAILPGAFVELPLIHRNTAGIFLLFLVIAYGWIYLTKLKIFSKRIYNASLVALISLLILFQTTQFIVRYFVAYTRFNPLLWRSDSASIMAFASDKKNEFDQIVFSGFEDAIISYAFHNNINPTSFQTFSIRNEPNSQGWIHYQSYENISHTGDSIDDFLCVNDDKSVLFITTPIEKYEEWSIYETRDYTGVHILHEAYDVNLLRSQLVENGWNRETHCIMKSI